MLIFNYIRDKALRRKAIVISRSTQRGWKDDSVLSNDVVMPRANSTASLFDLPIAITVSDNSSLPPPLEAPPSPPTPSPRPCSPRPTETDRTL